MNALLYLFYFIQDLWAIPKVTKEIPKIEGETCEMPFFDFQGSIHRFFLRSTKVVWREMKTKKLKYIV